MVEFRQPTDNHALIDAARGVHEAWNDALARKDAEALAAPYTENAVIESPLVSYLLGTDEGVCAGWDGHRQPPALSAGWAFSADGLRDRGWSGARPEGRQTPPASSPARWRWRSG